MCQVTKLSVSNDFGKIELAKPNSEPGPGPALSNHRPGAKLQAMGPLIQLL
jgi:hypothetical protein